MAIYLLDQKAPIISPELEENVVQCSGNRVFVQRQLKEDYEGVRIVHIVRGPSDALIHLFQSIPESCMFVKEPFTGNLDFKTFYPEMPNYIVNDESKFITGDDLLNIVLKLRTDSAIEQDVPKGDMTIHENKVKEDFKEFNKATQEDEYEGDDNDI